MTASECVRAVQRHIRRKRSEAVKHAETVREAAKAGEVAPAVSEYFAGRVDGLSQALAAVLSVEFDD